MSQSANLFTIDIESFGVSINSFQSGKLSIKDLCLGSIRSKEAIPKGYRSLRHAKLKDGVSLAGSDVVFGWRNDPLLPLSESLSTVLLLTEEILLARPNSLNVQTSSSLAVLLVALLAGRGKQTSVSLAFETLSDTSRNTDFLNVSRPSEAIEALRTFTEAGVTTCAQLNPEHLNLRSAIEREALREIRSLANFISFRRNKELLPSLGTAIREGHPALSYDLERIAA